MSGTVIHDTAFLNRFRSVWFRKRQVQLGLVVLSSLLLLLLGIGGLAIADHSLELSHLPRTVALGTVFGMVALFASSSLWKMFRQRSQPATAAEIESAFPELGQSVRTTVQFGTMETEQYRSEGVATTLVEALARQTYQRALPLTIEDVIPAKRMWIFAGCLATGALLLLAVSSVDWEWRNAIQRAVLAESAYRDLQVRPGDQTVDEGTGVEIEVTLIGRTNRDVVLFTRSAETPDAEWTERSLDPKPAQEEIQTALSAGSPDEPNGDPSTTVTATPLLARPRLALIASLNRLTKPVEYRVTAGKLESPTYRIDIRRPLRIEEIKIEITPPSYTGQEATVSLEPNLNVLVGTSARFDIKFDKPIKSAAIVLGPRKKALNGESPNEPQVVPLEVPAPNSQNTFSASLLLNENLNYSIVAEAVDGTKLPETKHRVRVREDQPPQVTIEEPVDAIEVHSLTELPMRIVARDDYGLAKAGVIFQVNDEQSIPLIAQDFATVVAAAKEVAKTGKVSPTTHAALEKILPLEFFELTQKDSVMYFAFAEDNRPGSPQRTETDTRFVDIRPFKRTYSVIDPDPEPATGMGGGFKSLEELIKRQRFGVNRTLQLEKRANAGLKPDAVTLDELMKFETELAKNVRETAEGLQARGFDDVELFFQAETAMLAAVDSLSVGKWANATLQMKDALKALIEQRDRTQMVIMKNPDPARIAAMRAFDRLQAQKLRRPKTDKEEARELIQRLKELIEKESTVAESLEPESPASNKPEVSN